MPIVCVEPVDYRKADRVSVESDAADNARAILEINEWAAAHDFVRVKEYWLQQIDRNGKRIFKSACYRLTEEDKRQARERCRRHSEILAQMPVTEHVVE